jgi:hypothetical protein
MLERKRKLTFIHVPFLDTELKHPDEKAETSAASHCGKEPHAANNNPFSA